MNRTLFTIITVTYNVENTIERCLNSIYSQTFPSYELLIIDGKSHDRSLEVIQSHPIKPRLVLSEKDKGIYDAMNKGIRLAKGEYLYFLNADDSLASSKTLSYVARDLYSKRFPDIATYGVFKQFPQLTVVKNAILSKHNLSKGIMPPHQGMFVRKTVFETYGLFALQYRYAGDFEFCCRIHREHSKESSSYVVANFFAGGSGSDKTITYAEQLKIIFKYFGAWKSILFGLNKYFCEIPLSYLLKNLGILHVKNKLLAMLYNKQNDAK